MQYINQTKVCGGDAEDIEASTEVQELPCY